MGTRYKGFIRPYVSLASEEALEKAQLWYSRMKAHEISSMSLRTDDFYRRKQFRSFSQFGASAYDLILAVDISRRCLSLTTVYLVIAMLEASKGIPDDAPTSSYPPEHSIIKANWSVCSYLWQSVDALFHLILQGHDVMARVIGRSILEASDYWLAIQNDRLLAGKYVTAQEDFDKLWYDELRSGKLVKLRKKALASFFGGDQKLAEEISDFRDDAVRDFSQAVHPSYLAGIWNFINHRKFFPKDPNWDFLDDWLHERVCIATVEASNLPLAIFAVWSASGDPRVDFLPNLEDKKFRLGKEGFAALLHGSMLAGSIVNEHHTRFPARSTQQ